MPTAWLDFFLYWMETSLTTVYSMIGIWLFHRCSVKVTFIGNSLYLRLNKWLSKQSRSRWFEMPPRSLWGHCYAKCIGKVHVCRFRKHVILQMFVTTQRKLKRIAGIEKLGSIPWRFFSRNSMPWKIRFIIVQILVVRSRYFYTCHYSTTVVRSVKFYNNHVIEIG